METKKETEIWTKLNKKEVEDIKDYYVSLDNKQRDKLPPVLNMWFLEVCQIKKGN